MGLCGYWASQGNTATPQVIEFRTSVHKCQRCGEEFVPNQHQRLDKHFHGLKSWVIFQHVEYRVSLETVGKMVEELFGIRILLPEIYMFKSLMAGNYRLTYQRLLKKILSGNLLHVDETEVRLQTGKGYVWVFPFPSVYRMCAGERMKRWLLGGTVLSSSGTLSQLWPVCLSTI